MNTATARPPFSLDGYYATVAGILARGYSLSDFHRVKPEAAHLILRHDIDQSIQRARRLAEVEAAAGWRSSFFVLMRSEMYNPRSPENVADLRAIAAMGHEIGLHFDTALEEAREEQDAAAAKECELLEEITRAPVRIVSFHRPTPGLIGGERLIAGRLHTYMDRFTSAMGYCSDSRGEWKNGHPWDHPVLVEGRALQLLTHPVWWVDSADATPEQRLAAVLAERAAVLDRELATNNAVWRDKSLESAVSDRCGGNHNAPASVKVVRLDQSTLEGVLPKILEIAADLADGCWSEENFRRDLPQKWQLSLLAMVGNVPVGYAIVSERATGHAHLHQFMIAPAFRNRGIGTRLLANSVVRAASRGYPKYTLKVGVANTGARRFYASNGFVETDAESDRVWMICQIPPV